MSKKNLLKGILGVGAVGIITGVIAYLNSKKTSNENTSSEQKIYARDGFIIDERDESEK